MISCYCLPQSVIYGNLAASMRVVVTAMEKLGIPYSNQASQVIDLSLLAVSVAVYVCMHCTYVCVQVVMFIILCHVHVHVYVSFYMTVCICLSHIMCAHVCVCLRT